MINVSRIADRISWSWVVFTGKVSEVTTRFNTLRPRQNDRHFADDSFKCIFLEENFRIVIKNSLKYVPLGLIENKTALVQIVAWRRIGDKPLSEAILVCFTDA